MKLFSIIILPIVILLIIIWALKNKIDVYESFMEGAKDGLKIVFNITPAILAMIFAVNIFLNSNVLVYLISPIKNIFNLPVEILPMALLRPISGTASLSLMTSVFKKYGPDSFYGNLASILQGCTDTTIYVIALYYSSIKVSKTRYTVIVGLLADVVGIVMGFILANIFF